MSDLLPAMGMWLRELSMAGGQFEVRDDPGARTVTITFRDAVVKQTEKGKVIAVAEPAVTVATAEVQQ